MSNSSKNKCFIVFVLFIFSISIIFIYYYLNSKYDFGIPCIYYEITHLYCPGCGITRAIFCLLNFDIINAMHNNLMLFIIGPFILIDSIYNIKNWICNKNNKSLFSNKIWICLLTIALIFGIIRNFDAFYFLQPIN